MYPMLIIADLENQGLYNALPLWDEQIEFLTIAETSHHSLYSYVDLVLLDCGYDDELGLSMLRGIKLNNPAVPVVFVTSAGSEKTAVNAFRFGAREYINLPVDLLELRNTLQKLLEAKRTHSWDKWRHHLTSCPAHNPETRTAADASPHLLRCIKYIKENFASPISLDTMAREGGLSKSYFCREFKRVFGMTPMHFLSRVRIRRSKDLLQKDLPVSSIALKVGFNDLSSFNRHFRNHVGVNPTQFRKSLRGDTLVHSGPPSGLKQLRGPLYQGNDCLK